MRTPWAKTDLRQKAITVGGWLTGCQPPVAWESLARPRCAQLVLIRLHVGEDTRSDGATPEGKRVRHWDAREDHGS